MTSLVNDVKEKVEISYKTIDILEGTIAVICGEKGPEREERKEEPRMDSVFRDMEKLNENMLRILKDVEVLKTLVCGSEVTCSPVCGQSH